jgi:hypothetical protein
VYECGIAGPVSRLDADVGFGDLLLRGKIGSRGSHDACRHSRDEIPSCELIVFHVS